MGDWFYRSVVFVGRFPFWVSSRPLVMHADRVPRQGPFILASNHLGFADVPLLMRSTPRRLDFVSIVEIFRNPLLGWFYGNMNAFPLDRRRADPKTVRVILDRLERGRVVALFPEGRIKPESESVIHGGAFRPGVARIATMAGVPIVPVVVWGASAYSRAAAWLPLKRTRYGVIYGQPITVVDEAAAERQLAEAYQQLYRELRAAMDQRSADLRAVYSENMPSSR